MIVGTRHYLSKQTSILLCCVVAFPGPIALLLSQARFPLSFRLCAKEVEKQGLAPCEIANDMQACDVVWAIHEFDAENPDEISFKIGEKVVVYEKDDQYQDGWWQVR